MEIAGPIYGLTYIYGLMVGLFVEYFCWWVDIMIETISAIYWYHTTCMISQFGALYFCGLPVCQYLQEGCCHHLLKTFFIFLNQMGPFLRFTAITLPTEHLLYAFLKANFHF